MLTCVQPCPLPLPQNDMLADDLEHYSEQNQKLNKECEAQTTEIASLQERLAAAEAKVNHMSLTPSLPALACCVQIAPDAKFIIATQSDLCSRFSHHANHSSTYTRHEGWCVC